MSSPTVEARRPSFAAPDWARSRRASSPRRSLSLHGASALFARRRSSSIHHPHLKMPGVFHDSPEEEEAAEVELRDSARKRTSSLTVHPATWLRMLGLRNRDSNDSASSNGSLSETSTPTSPTLQPPTGEYDTATAQHDTPDAQTEETDDYAIEEEDEEDEMQDSHEVRRVVTLASPAPSPAPEPESTAPESAHDAVVAQFVRPSVPRSMSSPAVPKLDPSPPLPSRQGESLDPNQRTTDDSRAVSAMLDGALEPAGTRVTRALGSQIDAVLAAQEEIGKRHLALEGWHAGEGDEEGRESERELERRAKGVEDIMARLGDLSIALKSYHALGTPALVFPAKSQRTPLAPTATTPPFPPLQLSRSRPRSAKLEIRTDLPDDNSSPALTPNPPLVTISNPGTARAPGLSPLTPMTPGIEKGLGIEVQRPTTAAGERGVSGERGGERRGSGAAERVISGERGGERRGSGAAERVISGERGERARKEGKEGKDNRGDGVRTENEAEDRRSRPPVRIPGLPRRTGSMPGLLAAGGGSLSGMPGPMTMVQSPVEMGKKDQRPW